MRLAIRILVTGLALVMLSACSTAPQYHPLMLCSQVSQNLLACMDSDQYKKLQGAPDEPLQPKPQSVPTPTFDPRRGA